MKDQKQYSLIGYISGMELGAWRSRSFYERVSVSEWWATVKVWDIIVIIVNSINTMHFYYTKFNYFFFKYDFSLL